MIERVVIEALFTDTPMCRQLRRVDQEGIYSIVYL